MGGREPLRRPRTRHDSHTIVASTRARARSTNLSIYLQTVTERNGRNCLRKFATSESELVLALQGARCCLSSARLSPSRRCSIR